MSAGSGSSAGNVGSALRPRAILLSLLAAFTLLASHGRGSVPVAHDDEAWLVIPGWSFWETGRFGSPAFEGFHGMDRCYYGFLPLFPIATGGAMRLLGPTLATARLVPLAFVLAILVLTWELARRLLSTAHANAAVAILAFWPLALPTEALASGLPMLDLSRFVRNDVAAAAFGMAALLAALPPLERREEREERRGRFLAAGLLAGLAVLGHVTALAFAAAVLALVPPRRAPPFLAGLLLPLVPYLLYVARGWDDFLGQNRGYAPRFAFSPRFFAENFWNERTRYRAFLQRLLAGDPAALLFVLLLVLGLVLLARERRAVLLVPVLLVPLLFALFLTPKNATYLASVWPLLSLAASAGLLALSRAGRWGRAASAAVVLLAALEGSLALRDLTAKVRVATPHERIAARLLPLVPEESRILAMNAWWFALGPARPGFRSAMVPILRASPSHSERAEPFGAAAEELRPDLLLVDETLGRFLAGEHPLAAQIRAYLEARFSLAARLEDPTYGVIRLYARKEELRLAKGPPPR